MNSSQSKSAELMGILISAFLFLILCAAFWGFAADDAYIVGRYAQNAADGLGLVYNPGEYVSALTSPLHGLFETALAALGFDPVQSYRVLAPGFVLIGWFAAIRLTGLNGQKILVFTALSLLSPFLILWSVGGLETALLACLATLFTVQLINMAGQSRANDGAFVRLGGLAALMFLCRFDSVLITAPVLFAILLVEFRRPALWAGAALCLGLVGAWLLFSQVYYGELFPTSFYLKYAFGGEPRIDSISALLNFALLSGLVLVLPLLKPATRDRRSGLGQAILRGAAVSLVLFLLYASNAAGQHMMFGYRLFVPYLMGASLIIVLSASQIRQWIPAVLIGAQALMIGVVYFLGVNPAPLTRLPGLQHAYAEYEFVTPTTYGRFMEMLRQDAHEIAAHWETLGRSDQPKIYLRTGGTGYYLPDFYVYESLISYRHGCGVQLRESILAAHYMQQLGFSRSGTLVEDLARARRDIADDAPLMFETVMDWDGPKATGYLFGPDPVPLSLPSQVGGGCAPRPEPKKSGT